MVIAFHCSILLVGKMVWHLKKNCFSKEGTPIIKIAELNNGISSRTTYNQDLFDKDVYLTKGDLTILNGVTFRR